MLEMLWRLQMPWIIGCEVPSRTLEGNFRKNSESVFGSLSGIFPEFLPESPSRTGGKAQKRFLPQMVEAVTPAANSYADRSPPTNSTLVLNRFTGEDWLNFRWRSVIANRAILLRLQSSNRCACDFTCYQIPSHIAPLSADSSKSWDAWNSSSLVRRYGLVLVVVLVGCWLVGGGCWLFVVGGWLW